METLNTIIGIIAGVFGVGWGFQFLYYRYEKRKRGAEAKIAALDADAKEDAYNEAELKRAYDRIVQIQDIANRERDKWAALAVELSELKLQLLQEKEARAIADRDKCTVVGCEHRIPPRAQQSQT